MNPINYHEALNILNDGLPIIFQTDTLPAIGCLPKFSEVIYQFKKRDKNKPLILMGAEQQQLVDYVHESAKQDYKNISNRYWPGALTIIIPASDKDNTILTSRDRSLGLRIPKSYMAQSLIKKSGPLLTSSANISGLKGSITAEEIALDFPTIKILGPVPWKKCSGSASTIISWEKSGDWRLIREGKVLIEGLY